MALSQFNEPIAGTCFDHSRSTPSSSKCYPAPSKVLKLTVGGTATAGTYSAKLNGSTFSFVRAAEDNTGIASGLETDAKSNDLPVNDIVAVSRKGLEIFFTGRQTGDSFTITNVTAPAPGTLTLATVNDGVEGDLELGLGVCLVAGDPDSIRAPQTGDTKIFGVSLKGGNLKPRTGATDEVDAYAPGSDVEVGRHGYYTVYVEQAVSAGDPVYCRATAAGSEIAGAFRKDADGGDAVLVPGEFLRDADADGIAYVFLHLPS